MGWEHVFAYIYKVPLRDVCDVKSRGRRNDDKGHEGNTAVNYVGGNMVKETAGQEFLLTIIYFEHYCTRTAVGRR